MARLSPKRSHSSNTSRKHALASTHTGSSGAGSISNSHVRSCITAASVPVASSGKRFPRCPPVFRHVTRAIAQEECFGHAGHGFRLGCGVLLRGRFDPEQLFAELH